jgi:hypothetical protein
MSVPLMKLRLRSACSDLNRGFKNDRARLGFLRGELPIPRSTSWKAMPTFEGTGSH